MSTETYYDSPRIACLVDDLNDGKENAFQQFKEEVLKSGAPLIEAVTITEVNEDGEDETVIDDDYVRATFLYFGDKTTENVTLYIYFMYERSKDDPKKHIIKRLENTPLWYWTEKVAKDTRTQYFIKANNPFTPEEELDTREKEDEYTQLLHRGDDLNPDKFFMYINHENPDAIAETAIFTAPDASPQTDVNKREGVAEGQIIKETFVSTLMDNERPIWIYLPPGYDAEREQPYHFLLLFDGYVAYRTWNAGIVLDNLISEGRIPATICLMLGNSSDGRIKEFPPGGTMPDMISDELMPYLREKYSISEQAEHAIISGSSFGGLAATQVAFEKAHIFGNVLGQSSSYWWNPASTNPEATEPDDLEHGWLIRQFATSEKRNLRFYLNCGRFETTDYWNEGISMRSLNRHMRDVLLAKGYPVHYQEFAGGHDMVWWRQTLADGLIALHTMNGNV